MKIIFLDIDGVLNCETTKERCGYYVGIDRTKVQLLKKIVDATDAKIVLCSTWRLGYNNFGSLLKRHIPYMKSCFEAEDIEIMDYTPDIQHSQRGHEIRKWMDEHPEIEIDEWIVLDDEIFYDYFSLGISSHLVQTNYRENGLINTHVELAIQMLNEGVDETKEIGLDIKQNPEVNFNENGWWL